jgi:hypothetical protein
MRSVMFGMLLGITLTLPFVARTGSIGMELTPGAEGHFTGTSHWRFHDGHWGYWHEGDDHWYFTDGANWFYHDGNAWRFYHFDNRFGREGFERADYRLPLEDTKLRAPTHSVYRPK